MYQYNLGKVMFPHLHFQAALILSLFLLPAFAKFEPCSESFLQEAQDRNITGNCQKKTLGAEFGWNYFNNTRKLEILFGAKLNGEIGWLAWGLNPGEQPMMIGTRALIGIKEETTLRHGTYNITVFTKFGCELLTSKIELEVLNFRFFHAEQIDVHMIQATIILPQEYSDSRANVVWQVGNSAKGEQPLMHPVHGILNILGWGLLLPFGAIIARYFRRYPFECSSWFSLHILCQILGYTLGTVGFIIGLLLGSASGYYSRFRIHRLLGIIVFTFATLQMLALRLKPNQKDDYRVYWNMYHHFLGYALLAMISVNIFQGIAILSTDHIWNWAYVGILVLLGFIAFSFEVFSWVKFCISKSEFSAVRYLFGSPLVTVPVTREVHEQIQLSRSSQ